jgi:hypothetical protein
LFEDDLAVLITGTGLACIDEEFASGKELCPLGVFNSERGCAAGTSRVFGTSGAGEAALSIGFRILPSMRKIPMTTFRKARMPTTHNAEVGQGCRTFRRGDSPSFRRSSSLRKEFTSTLPVHHFFRLPLVQMTVPGLVVPALYRK